MNRERDGVLVGLGAGITLVVLLVLQSFVGSGLLSTRVETSTVTTTVNIPPPLDLLVYQWVYYVSARYVPNLADMYAQNATVTWSGNLEGPLGGTYRGQSNIKILFGSSIGKENALTATFANYQQKVVSPTETNATFSLFMSGTSVVSGNFNATVDVSQEWSYSAVAGEPGAQQWQIASENWNYVTSYYQYPLGFF